MGFTCGYLAMGYAILVFYLPVFSVSKGSKVCLSAFNAIYILYVFLRGGIFVPLVTREDSAVFPVASRPEHLDLGDCEVLSPPPWSSMNLSKNCLLPARTEAKGPPDEF